MFEQYSCLTLSFSGSHFTLSPLAAALDFGIPLFNVHSWNSFITISLFLSLSFKINFSVITSHLYPQLPFFLSFFLHINQLLLLLYASVSL